MAAGDSAFANSGGPLGTVQSSPFVEGQVVSDSRPQEATFNPGKTQRSPFVSDDAEAEAGTIYPDLPAATAEALTAAGADEGELSKIHDLIVQKVEGVADRIAEAMETDLDAVKVELAKLREEFGFGPKPATEPVAGESFSEVEPTGAAEATEAPNAGDAPADPGAPAAQ